MRRLAILGGVVVALVCLSGVLVVADPGLGAIIEKDIACWISPLAGAPDFLETYDTQQVITPSGNAKLTCHFEFDPLLYPQEKATKTTGFSCGILGAGSTTDSQTIVTPSGNVLLVCKIKANAAP